jgi:hypothetical protein
MNCCDYDCNQGRDCPARKPLRQVVEEDMGVAAKPAKVRQRYPMINRETPSHWRKTLKVWAIVALVFIGLSFISGMVAGIIERVWP